MANNSALTSYVQKMVEERKESRKALTDLGAEGAKIQMKAGVDQASDQRKFGQDMQLKQMDQQGQMEREKLQQRGQNFRLFQNTKSREKIAAMNAGKKNNAGKDVIDNITGIGQLLQDHDLMNQENESKGAPREEIIDVVDSKLATIFPSGTATEDELRDYVSNLAANAKDPDYEFMKESLGERWPEIFSKQGGTMGEQVRPQATGKAPAAAGTGGKVVTVGKYKAVPKKQK